MTPNIFTICAGAAQVFNVTYEDEGEGDWNIETDETWLVAGENGEVNVVEAPSTPGVYKFIMKQTIGEGEEAEDVYFEFTIIVEDCSKDLKKKTFVFCSTDEAQDIQLASITGTANTFSTESAIGITGGGLISIDPAELDLGAHVMDITYFVGATEYNTNITITIVDCEQENLSTYDECEKEPIHLIWLNQEGGWKNYYFNQIKTYGVRQKEARAFINADREERYSSRGRVNQIVQIDQRFIPQDHMELISTLRDAIQAFITTDIEDPDAAVAIILDENDYTERKTGDSHYRVSFSFKYAKNKLIQNQ